jgi:hypothetical protein
MRISQNLHGNAQHRPLVTVKEHSESVVVTRGEMGQQQFIA